MVRIPYKLVGGILLISVTANGKNGFFFVSDTGASICLLGKAFGAARRSQPIPKRRIWSRFLLSAWGGECV